MAITSTASFPAGVRNTTSSPTSRPSRARATGDARLTSPRAVSASSTPMMVTVRSRSSAPVGKAGAKVTVAPKKIRARLAWVAGAIDLAQAALAVLVVAVLGAVAVAGRPGDDLDDARPLAHAELVVFGAKAGVADGGDVAPQFGRGRGIVGFVVVVVGGHGG